MNNRDIRLQPKGAVTKMAAIILTVSMLAYWAGCSSNPSTGVNSAVSKRINEILVSEDHKFWYCT